jgi:hypothetical protein
VSCLFRGDASLSISTNANVFELLFCPHLLFECVVLSAQLVSLHSDLVCYHPIHSYCYNSRSHPERVFSMRECSQFGNVICMGTFRSTLLQRTSIGTVWMSLVHLSKALISVLAFMRFKSAYVCPVPTNIMGCPDTYVMEIAAPTLSSIVSNLVRTMPSIPRG